MKHPLLSKNTSALRLGPALELRFAVGKTEGEFEGYGSVFGGPPDSYGDIIERGAFARTLADYSKEGRSPAMLWSHDQAAPIGRWTEMREDEQGLFVRGSLNLATSRGRDAYEHVKQGDVSGLSIGFMIASNGSRKGPNNVRVLTDIELAEVSVVAYPANRRARIAGVKSLTSKNDLIGVLRDGGLSKVAAARVAAGGWSALAGEDHQKAIDLAADIARATAQLRTK